MMCKYLITMGVKISPLTTYRYMKELNIKSIVRKRKPKYIKGDSHKVFENKLNRNFTADKKNRNWCTDFTYVYFDSKRYNFTIIDLYDRSIIAIITDRFITADLAIRTLEKAIKVQKNIDTTALILHSDQGSQYTSKDFVDFCTAKGITQSMNKAGCPYDNATMERYFNTLKNELLYLYDYDTEEELYKAIDDFAYVHYNHKRPHTFNGHKTPFQRRYGD